MKRDRLMKFEKQLREYNNHIADDKMAQYESSFRKAFGFFAYCSANDLTRLFKWFRANPVPFEIEREDK